MFPGSLGRKIRLSCHQTTGMDPEQDYGGNVSLLGGHSQGIHQVEARVQRMAPVIHTNLPGMPDPLNPAPTQGFPWAFPDPRGYSDHESITSSSDCASFATMSSLDRKKSAISIGSILLTLFLHRANSNSNSRHIWHAPSHFQASREP